MFRRTSVQLIDNKSNGGEGGIRTPDTLSGMPVFKTGAINHSATSPRGAKLQFTSSFIAGDDLLADFKVDLTREYDPSLNPADRHAYTYTRNVLERGSTQTCLECHRVHGRPDLKHEYCVDCDELPAAKSAGKLRSETCQY